MITIYLQILFKYIYNDIFDLVLTCLEPASYLGYGCETFEVGQWLCESIVN